MQGVSAITESSSYILRLVLHVEADGTKENASCTDTKPATTQGETDELEDLVDRFSLAVWAITRIVRSCLLGEPNNGQSLPERDQAVLQTCLAELAAKLRAESKTRIEVRVGKASEHLRVMSGMYGDEPFEIQVTTDEWFSIRPCVAGWCDSTMVPTGWTHEKADDILLNLVLNHALGMGEILPDIFRSKVDSKLSAEQDNVIDANDLVAVTHAVRAAHNFLKRYPQ